MSDLSVSMFGKIQIDLKGQPSACSLPQKAQELLAYLLLHRRNHPREKLASLLWPHGTTKRAKAYLRKALWQLRQSLGLDEDDTPLVLHVDDDWVQIHPEADLWVDVTVFENAFDEVRDCPVSEMTSAQVTALEEAASLYTGDLLENWYQEWCLKERERLKDVFLRMLDRLTRCCEQKGSYDSGIQYGRRALRIDPARERIHRHLMRLRARAGDRTGALRQYERCTEVLDDELDVTPTTATRRLHERIQEDRFPSSETLESPATTRGSISHVSARFGDGGPNVLDSSKASSKTDEASLREGVERIRQLQNTLAAVQRQIRRDVETVEVVLQQRES